MTDLRDTIAAVNAEVEADERGAVEDLEPLLMAKEGAASWDKERKRYDPSASEYPKMGRVRRYLTDHGGVGGDPLIDHELRIIARLTSGGHETVYDPPSAIKARNPQLYRRLVELNLIVEVLDVKAVEKAIADSLLVPGDLEGFVKEVDRTPKLDINRMAT